MGRRASFLILAVISASILLTTLPSTTAFTRVGALTLNSGENFLLSAVVDAVGGYAYFGTGTGPGVVVKVRLSDFTRVGALTLNSGENTLLSAVVDAVGGYAYFGTGIIFVVKIRLSDFTRVGALTLNSGENTLESAVLDAAGGYAYFGSNTSPGVVVKVAIADIPSAPASLTATGGRGKVTLSWTPPTSNGGVPITGYKIYRGLSSGGETLLTTLGDLYTSYTDTAVSPGIPYYYKVTAVNNIGESGSSVEAAATPTSAAGSLPSLPVTLILLILTITAARAIRNRRSIRN